MEKIIRNHSGQTNINIDCICLRSWKENIPWSYMHMIPALRRLRQEDCEFEASLGYMMRPPHLKTNERKKITKHLKSPQY
jgi:hypothetical protein